MMGEGFPVIWMVTFRFLIPIFQRFLCLFKCPMLSFSGTELLASLATGKFWMLPPLQGIPLIKVVGIKTWPANSLGPGGFSRYRNLTVRIKGSGFCFLFPNSRQNLLWLWPVWLHSNQRCCNLSLSFGNGGWCRRHEGKSNVLQH